MIISLPAPITISDATLDSGGPLINPSEEMEIPENSSGGSQGSLEDTHVASPLPSFWMVMVSKPNPKRSESEKPFCGVSMLMSYHIPAKSVMEYEAAFLTDTA